MENQEQIDNEDNSVKFFTRAFDLWLQAWAKAGKSLFYMKFLHEEIDYKSQQVRVEQMCYHLAVEHRNHLENTSENRKWFKKWIEKFDAEVENQC